MPPESQARLDGRTEAVVFAYESELVDRGEANSATSRPS
jgi:hypothetical protein